MLNSVFLALVSSASALAAIVSPEASDDFAFPGIEGATAELPGASLFVSSPAALFGDDEETIMNKWTGAISAGGTLLRGNTEALTAAVTADAQYRREEDRTTLAGWFNYGEDETDGTTNVTQRKYGGRAQYDYFLSERTYALATFQAEHDSLANIDLRWTAGVGLGRQFVDKEHYRMSAEAGISYFVEEFDSSPDKEYVAARLAYDVYWQINDNVEFTQNGQAFPSLEESDDIYTRLDTRLDSSLTENMFARLQWVWDWNNTPAEGLERSDHRFIAGFGWNF